MEGEVPLPNLPPGGVVRLRLKGGWDGHRCIIAKNGVGIKTEEQIMTKQSQERGEIKVDTA